MIQLVDSAAFLPQFIVVRFSREHVQRLTEIERSPALGHRGTIGPPVQIQKGRYVDVRLSKLNGARPLAHGAVCGNLSSLCPENFSDPGHVSEGIQQNFRVQGARYVVSVVGAGRRCRFARCSSKLIRPRGHDQPEHPLHVIALRHELFGKRPQQLGMRGGIGRTQVIHRVDEPAAEEERPEAVHRRFREVLVRRHPFGQIKTHAPLIPVFQNGSIEQCRRNLLLRARMQNPILALTHDIRSNLLTHRVIENDGVVTRPAGPEHMAEERGQTPKLVLCPVFIGMIVAARAIEAASQEDLGLLEHGVRRKLDDLQRKEVPRRATVPLGGDAFASHLVEGPVRRHVIADPLPVVTAPLGVDAVLIDRHPEEIRKAIRPVVDVFRRVKKNVDELLALVRIFILKELTDSRGRG